MGLRILQFAIRAMDQVPGLATDKHATFSFHYAEIGIMKPMPIRKLCRASSRRPETSGNRATCGSA